MPFPFYRYLIVSVLGCAGGAQASQIVVGAPPTSGICEPFGCASYTPSLVYQQVYSSSQFFGPVRLPEITFQSTISPGGYIVYSKYDFYLSTTTRAVDQLSPVFNSNLGANNQLFWSGILMGPASIYNTLTIYGTNPFNYDPSKGNLLLTIVRTPLAVPAGVQSGGIRFDGRAGNSGGVFSRMSDYYNNLNGDLNNNYGLTTYFSDYSAFSPFALPEPASFLLLGCGLVGLGALRLYRKDRG